MYADEWEEFPSGPSGCWPPARRRRRLIKARSWNHAGGAARWRKATPRCDNGIRSSGSL